MEDVLDIYSWEYDETHPVVCMDEQPTQLVRETRQPLPTRRGAPKQYNVEYQRNGMANSFLFTEPLAGWRKVSVRATKTKKDWASEVQLLLDHDYPDAERVILVCDNLNTHTFGALYDTFGPEEAKRLADRLDIRHTPKHGSWMNMAEIELSAMTRQCLSRRIADIATLRSETNRWAARRNRNQTGINWQFKTGKARTKLKSLYPQILTGYCSKLCFVRG
jgi:hypothetical protein